MRIVLCCAGGLSTTMLMNSMKDTVHNSAKLNDADLILSLFQLIFYNLKQTIVMF